MLTATLTLNSSNNNANTNTTGNSSKSNVDITNGGIAFLARHPDSVIADMGGSHERTNKDGPPQTRSKQVYRLKSRPRFFYYLEASTFHENKSRDEESGGGKIIKTIPLRDKGEVEEIRETILGTCQKIRENGVLENMKEKVKEFLAMYANLYEMSFVENLDTGQKEKVLLSRIQRKDVEIDESKLIDMLSIAYYLQKDDIKLGDEDDKHSMLFSYVKKFMKVIEINTIKDRNANQSAPEKGLEGMMERDIIIVSFPSFHVLPEFSVLIPGLIDTHAHASQFPFLGTGISKPLMAPDGFLHGFAFPTESTFSDVKKAEILYDRVVRCMLSNGTTTSVYYATIHTESSLILARTCRRLGQRAFIGKIQLDQMSEDCESSVKTCLNETEKFITDGVFYDYNPSETKCPEVSSSLVQPILTPRFIPSCSKALLQGLAKLSQQCPCVMVQTHVTQSLDEVQSARTLWNSQIDVATDATYESDSQVLRDTGLLKTERMIAAHCVHVDKKEIEIMKRNKVGIAHCPLSNFSFADGTLDIAELMVVNEYEKIGLGTDIAGGYSPSMLNAMRSAVVASKSLKNYKKVMKLNSDWKDKDASADTSPETTALSSDNDPLNIFDAFYLATVGGSKVCCCEDVTGTFDTGKDLDALILHGHELSLELWKEFIIADDGTETKSSLENDESSAYILVERLFHLCDDRHVRNVWVRGCQVK